MILIQLPSPQRILLNFDRLKASVLWTGLRLKTMAAGNVDKEKMMLSRMSATFFNRTLQYLQKRNYITEMHEISSICHTIEAGKIREAKQLKYVKQNNL